MKILIILLKFFISAILVIILAEISKKINPILSGIISGLPLGTALSFYFIAKDFGLSYILNGIPWAVAGLIASIIFCFLYYLAGTTIKIKNRVIHIIITSWISIVGFMISGIIIYKMNLNTIIAIFLFTLFFLLNIFILKKLHIHQKKEFKNSLNWKTILFRGILVGLIILSINLLAGILGKKWAGILTAFPSTLFPLLLVLHFEEKNILYPSIIYGFSFGIVNLAIFYISCLFILPKLGLNWGFLIVYIIAIVVLFGINLLKNRIYKSKI